MGSEDDAEAIRWTVQMRRHLYLLTLLLLALLLGIWEGTLGPPAYGYWPAGLALLALLVAIAWRSPWWILLLSAVEDFTDNFMFYLMRGEFIFPLLPDWYSAYFPIPGIGTKTLLVPNWYWLAAAIAVAGELALRSYRKPMRRYI